MDDQDSRRYTIDIAMYLDSENLTGKFLVWYANFSAYVRHAPMKQAQAAAKAPTFSQVHSDQ